MHSEYVKSRKPTFPLRGKTPITRKWSKIKFSSEKIEGNFGWKLSAADLVVDVDPRNGGIEDQARLEDKLGFKFDDLPSLAIVETGGGGTHYIFKNPDRKKVLKKLRAYPGIDFLSVGHYVVGVGSIHPTSGLAYQWRFDSVELNDTSCAPAQLLDIIGKRKINEAGITLDCYDDSKPVLKRFSSYLENSAPVSIEGCGGDHTAFIVACTGKDYGLSPAKTLELMLGHWNDRCVPEWDEDELCTKIINAYRYSESGKGNKHPTTMFGPISEEEKTLSEEDAHEQLHGLVPYDPKDAASNALSFVLREFKSVDNLVHVANKTLRYDIPTGLWKEISKHDVSHAVQKALGASKCSQSCIQQTIKGVLNHATPLGVFKSKPGVIGCRDGVIRITKNGHSYTEPHSPDNKITHAVNMSCRGSRKQKPKQWLNFLNEIFQGDTGLVESLREWIGYCLIPGNRYQKVGLFFGQSRSGKGTICRILNKITPTVGTSLKGMCGDFGLSSFLGKNVAIIGDAHALGGSYRDRALEVLLSISGEDVVDVNVKNSPILSTTLDAKILLVANEPPCWADSASALMNRYVVFPFKKSFAGVEDPLLESKLIAELAGIVDWALSGLKRLHRRKGFTIPSAAAHELSLLSRRSNPVKAFAEDMCIFGRGLSVDLHRLYEEYSMWCLTNDNNSMRKQAFMRRFQLAMQDVEVERGEKGTWNFTGVDLLDS